MRLKFWAAWLISAILCCGGCQSGGGKPADAKHLRVATGFKIQHLDPLKSGHYFLVEFGAAELPLILDSNGALKPWLLESYEQINNLNWRLRLRPDVKFQNGKLLTAEIFARAMNRQIEKSPETAALIGAATVKVSGDKELILTTIEPNPNVPAALADELGFPIYDVEAVEAFGADSLKSINMGVYTGAYQIVRLTDREMSLVKNENYRLGAPPFERVSVLFVGDPQARVLAVQAGEADIALYPQTQNKRLLANRADAFFQLSDRSSGGPSLFFNVRRQPFDDVNVRRALNLSINYESLAVDTMDSIYQPATGFYPAQFAWSKQNQRTDQAAAKNILDADGWRLNAAGIREKNGAPLAATLLIYPQQADFAVLATALQAQLRAVGFDVKIRQVDDIQSELKTSKTWNLVILGSGTVSTGGAPDPTLRRYFLSDSEENYAGISDAKLDELIKTLSRTFDEPERFRLLSEIQDLIIVEKAYLVRLGFTRARAIVGNRFRNYQPSPQLHHVTFETKPD